jgi:DNA-binding protein YbaB
MERRRPEPDGHEAGFSLAGLEDVRELARQVETWIGGFAATLRDLDEMEVTGAGAGGHVQAKVSGAGRLRSVTIDPRAMRDLDHVALGEAIREAVQSARAVAGEEVGNAFADLTGRPLPEPGGALPEDPLAPYIQALLREG